MIEIKATAKINGKLIEGNYRVTDSYSGFWIKHPDGWKQTMGTGDFYDPTVRKTKLKREIRSALFGYEYNFAPYEFSKIRVTYTFFDTVSGKKIK